MKKCDQEEWPECSGDPSACPENEGYGCGKGRAADAPPLSVVESESKTEGATCTDEEWNRVMHGQRCLRCGTEHIEIYPSSGKAVCLLSGCDWKVYRYGFVPFNPSSVARCADCGEERDNEFMTICKPCSIKRRDARLSSQNTERGEG